ncbi:hypothetical protein [Corynebacterium sp. HMSC14H10]|uniref:hypothetical protein n=1 Tax=Corynebacterium sp. HMSC14H10 TaxID=1581103 RepID=UPI000A7EF2C7|nr:hypothetical protein [Corynebacterium sp. HMSC14H10]
MILLIDGRSGSGKTTFSAKLHSILGWPVIHLEDVYPGWSGLQKASAEVAETILNPALPADKRGYRRWDWYASDSPSGSPRHRTPRSSLKAVALSLKLTLLLPAPSATATPGESG